jgi:hypothetical protein
VAPLPPVLRVPVEEEKRLAFARLGDVHSESGEVDEAVLHTGQFGQRQHRFTLPM